MRSNASRRSCASAWRSRRDARASPFWPPDNEQFFRKLAPELDYRMWDGVSHFLMMDKPDEFNRTLAEFVAGRKLLRLK